MDKHRILVVDDSPTVRMAIRRKLEGAGYDVHEAQSGLDAIKKVFELDRVDLITLDVEMPGMDGFTTCRKLQAMRRQDATRQDLADIKILFITANDSIINRRIGFELGALDFIGKSAVDAEIVSVVDNLLRPGKRFSGLRVMIVDDSLVVRRVVRDAVRQLGAETVEADTGHRALAILVAGCEKVDMLVSDLEMPEMDGVALTRAVREGLGLKKLPIIILSGVADKVTQLDLFRSGITDYIAKPFIKEELQARVRVQLEEVHASRLLRNSIQEVQQANRELEISRNSLAKANQELETARQRLERITAEQRELLHMLCHDLANPLCSIIGALDFADTPELLFDFREDMRSAAQNGIDIVELVRKMRAVEEGKFPLDLAPCRLADMLAEARTILGRRLNEKSLSIAGDVPPDLSVMADRASFVSSVVNNLLTNAIKFSPRGSAIEISARRAGPMVEMTVRDHGVGMPREVLDNLFNASGQTNRPGTEGESGTGFGMPLVKKFVEAYGGSIEVRSATAEDDPAGHGTEVRLALPAGP